MTPSATKPAWPMRLAELVAAGLVFLVSLAVSATPLGYLWVLSNLEMNATEFYLLALLGCPSAIVIAGWVLLRVNALYLAVARTGSRAVLETSVTLGVVVAMVAMAVWFFSGEGGTHLGP